MQTEILQRKPARRTIGRGARLWLGTAVVGLVAFLIAWTPELVDVPGVSGTLRQLEYVVYDRGMDGFARAYQRAHPQQGDVVVIAIKPSTYDDLRGTPGFVPGLKGPLNFRDHGRAFHARLLQNMKAWGAKVVVFDVLFDQEQPEVDGYFAQAIRDHGGVVLAAYSQSGVTASGQAEEKKFVVPVAALRDAAASIGLVDLPQDFDKSIRRFRWWGMGPEIYEASVDDRAYPALGVAAAALFSGADPRKVIQEEVQPAGRFLNRPIRFYPGTAPPQSYFRYYGQTGFPSGNGSVVDYQYAVRRGQDPDLLETLRQRVRGKIVLVGAEEGVGQDVHRVPVVSATQTLGDANTMPGVEIHAHVAQSALRGEYPIDAPAGIRMLLVVLLSFGFAALGRVLSPVPLLVLGAATLAALWTGGIQGVRSSAAVFLEPVSGSIGLIAAMGLETAFMYVFERRERARAVRQLGRHVGPGIAEKLTAENWPELSGESREITMLFTDLQGFTSIAETMTSAETCALLNRYFGVVFPILNRYGGTLDKLMGDGMMVYFGYPQRQPDHAARAIRCAIELQDALESWQRQPENAGLPPLRTRVGIHTGAATVGEVGSDGRVELTVIGDVVNVASRLEGMNKEFGTTILLSEATRSAAGEIVPMEYRGVATVRGRKEPTPVYSVEPEAVTGRQRTAARSASMRLT